MLYSRCMKAWLHWRFLIRKKLCQLKLCQDANSNCHCKCKYLARIQIRICEALFHSLFYATSHTIKNLVMTILHWMLLTICHLINWLLRHYSWNTKKVMTESFFLNLHFLKKRSLLQKAFNEELMISRLLKICTSIENQKWNSEYLSSCQELIRSCLQTL